jgi:hypothetical protein
MKRNTWLMVLGAGALSSMMGCQSNPYRPTMFQRFRNEPAGPELTAPPGPEGTYVGGDGSGGYPMAPNGAAPGYYPPPGTYPPPGSTSPPVQGFPQTMPPAPGQLPQGPPPKSTPITTNGTSR